MFISKLTHIFLNVLRFIFSKNNIYINKKRGKYLGICLTEIIDLKGLLKSEKKYKLGLVKFLMIHSKNKKQKIRKFSYRHEMSRSKNH